MKRKIKVSQKHRYTKDRNILYKGEATLHNKHEFLQIEYIEFSSDTLNKLYVYEDEIIVERKNNEMFTRLYFRKDTRTKGSITSQYGTINIEIDTFNYMKTEDVIALEYDIIVQGEVSDGYAIIWNMKEGIHE